MLHPCCVYWQALEFDSAKSCNQHSSKEDLIAAARSGITSAAAVLPVSPDTIMHVAMEYSIPHLGMNKEFLYGGLGMVVDLFAKVLLVQTLCGHCIDINTVWLTTCSA